MKRCPQCEFIYEDDQSLCDMDGVLLVLDSRTLPNHHALATVPGVPATPQQRRNRAVPVFASLVLALVLGMVYYVSTRRSAPVSATTISTPAPAVSEPTPEPQTAPAVVPERKPAATQSPAKKSSTKTTSTPQPKPTAQAKKEENKVGSILKKTGRILKKPFKF